MEVIGEYDKLQSAVQVINPASEYFAIQRTGEWHPNRG